MYSVICADDDHHMITLYNSILGDKGYDVRTCSDSTSVITSLNQRTANLLILDIDMPGRSGIDLCTELRQNNNQIPIILVSANDTEQTITDGLSADANDYIVKPFRPGELLAKITAVLRTYEASVENQKTYIADFEILNILGEGNMGRVYLAKRKGENGDTRYAIKVAKIFDQATEKTAIYRERFLREIKAATSVKHPNVIRIINHGFYNDPSAPYIAMEYFEGNDLKYYISESDNLTITQKTDIIRQIASALAAMHSQHICHRDIKPANILVGKDLVVKVTDFGIARLPDVLTLTSNLIGTPIYLSPEAFETSKVDERADIFSLGIVAYELYLGIQPFYADTLALIAREITTQRPFDPLRIDARFPMDLRSVLARMLAKEPANRYQSAEDIIDDLDSFTETQSHKTDVIDSTSVIPESSDWR